MNWRDEAGGAAAVLVAIDASKEITDYALDWAVRNIIRPGDTLILVGLLKALSPPSPPMALSSRLQPRRNQSGMNMLINSMLKKWRNKSGADSRKGKKADEGSVSRISEVCTEMMNEICFENNIKHVRTHVVVTLVPETHFGSVADKAEEYQASWLIIDRRLKKEGENCLKQLNCNIILIDHAIPKILRMVDSSTEGERSRGTTDVFWLRNSDGSIGTSGGYSSFTASGSVVSSTSDMDSGELRHGMPTSCVVSSPSPYKDFSSGEVTGRPEYQPKASHVSFAKPPIAPTKGNSNSIGGTDKPLPLPPNRSPLHPAMRGSRELEAETKPPSRSPLHPAVRGIRELGADQTGRPSPGRRPAEAESLHCPVSGGGAAGIQIHRESPLRSRVVDHHKAFAKPSIPPNAGTMKKTSTLGSQDGFTKGRSSVDSRSNSSTLPSDRSRQSFSSLLRMSSLKHIVDDELKNDPLQQLPIMDRTSSVRRAMSLTIKQPPVPPPLCSVCRHRAPMFGKPPRKFSYEEVERATAGFAEDNYLAEGGYGAVYRGVLEDGLVVAVKQHKTLSAQGASEFCSEVEVLSCAQHRNLVMLVGYCTEREWMLLYEFSCNGSLDNHLYANDMEEAMTWHHRQKVAVGAARGLRYLHEDCRVGCIVHRDFRPNNILLTHDFEPMVGDFGLARWQTDGQKAEETRIVGAFGYLAPEYVQTGQLTEKADVYSFGVLLMELISGVKATDLARCTGLQNLSQWALPLMDRNMMFGLIDPRLKGEYVEHEVECMMRVAGLCISPYPELRPRMSKVLRMLEGEAQAEPILHKPSLRPVSMPLDTNFLTRTEKNNSCFSYDGHAQRQRGGISTIDEQSMSQNLRRPPIPQKKFAVRIDEMKMASNSPILNQSGNLASKKREAHLDGTILEYLRRSRELAIQNAGLQY